MYTINIYLILFLLTCIGILSYQNHRAEVNALHYQKVSIMKCVLECPSKINDTICTNGACVQVRACYSYSLDDGVNWNNSNK